MIFTHFLNGCKDPVCKDPSPMIYMMLPMPLSTTLLHPTGFDGKSPSKEKHHEKDGHATPSSWEAADALEPETAVTIHESPESREIRNDVQFRKHQASTPPPPPPPLQLQATTFAGSVPGGTVPSAGGARHLPPPAPSPTSGGQPLSSTRPPVPTKPARGAPPPPPPPAAVSTMLPVAAAAAAAVTPTPTPWTSSPPPFSSTHENELPEVSSQGAGGQFPSVDRGAQELGFASAGAVAGAGASLGLASAVTAARVDHQVKQQQGSSGRVTDLSPTLSHTPSPPFSLSLSHRLKPRLTSSRRRLKSWSMSFRPCVKNRPKP